MGTPSARTEPSGPKSRKRQGELTFRFRKVKRGTGELGEGKPGRDRRGRRWRSGRRSCAWPSSPSRRSDTTVRDPIRRLRLADACLQWRRSWRPALWGNPCSVLCPKGIGRRWPSIRRGCISVSLLASRSEQQPAGRRSDFFFGVSSVLEQKSSECVVVQSVDPYCDDSRLISGTFP